MAGSLAILRQVMEDPGSRTQEGHRKHPHHKEALLPERNSQSEHRSPGKQPISAEITWQTVNQGKGLRTHPSSDPVSGRFAVDIRSCVFQNFCLTNPGLCEDATDCPEHAACHRYSKCPTTCSLVLMMCSRLAAPSH